MSKQQADTAVQTVACAFANCPMPARFRVQQAQGWAIVCKVHYEQLATKDAAAYCRAAGVHTIDQARAHLRKTLPTIGSKPPSIAWAQRILERMRAGENMPMYSVELAAQVVKQENAQRIEPQRLREPGEDESERSEEPL